LKIIIFSMVIVLILSGCYNMDTLSVRPSTTTVTYGKDSSTAEKDAKNDVFTDSEKESWTIKQVFKWGNEE
jgi:uncharacterized lipoprotein NlpE involved in copper resistance